jgi:hypothetical protein
VRLAVGPRPTAWRLSGGCVELCTSSFFLEPAARAATATSSTTALQPPQAYFTGQTKKSGEAAMYPKPVYDLQGEEEEERGPTRRDKTPGSHCARSYYAGRSAHL